MKRLFSCIIAFIFALGLVFIANTPVAEAKAKVKSSKKVVKSTAVMNIDDMVGKSIDEVIAANGKQNRVDESEYGFKWYVYNSDYNRFMMLGVSDGQVVAAYSNSKYLLAQNSIKIGITRATVRSQMGDPVTSVQKGNNIFVLANTDQKDIFEVDGGYYITVFYDKYDKYKVTSVMKIKKELEDEQLGKVVKLTPAMIEAYSDESLDLVNSIRARKGLSLLTYDSKAEKLANFRSTDMRDRNYFNHYSPEGNSPAYYAKKMGIKIKSLCENIACGHRTAISAFEAFMNSSGHRKNILYTKIKQMGAGTAYGGDRSVIVTYILLTKK